jgi:hypothetical protein
MDIKLDTTLERDMDLLIMEEFICSPQFARIFLDAVGIKCDYTIGQVIHSMRDIDLGESDIVFILNIGNKRHALHIEDKIDALAMPNQSGRYAQRAEKDIAAGKYDEYSVLIVAPAKYLSANQEAQKYEYQVQYEQLRAYFDVRNDLRSQYKLALIDRAIYDQKVGYQYEANPGVVSFCAAMDAYQKEHYPVLPIGTQAWWRGYKTMISTATIVYKANKGFCDLQFSNCTREDLLAKVKDYLSDRMTVEKAGKSASVRISVSPVWFENRFEDKVNEVDEALTAMMELYQLSRTLVKQGGIHL